MPLPQPQPDLVSLDLLQSVADFGSIRQAALAHGSRSRLRAPDFGTSRRTSDSISSTGPPVGAADAEWARHSRVVDSDYRRHEGLLEGAAALRSEAKGQLHVAASMTVAEYLVPQWLIRLRTTDRDMRVSLEMGNSEHVIDLVRDRRAELGFVEGTPLLLDFGASGARRRTPRRRRALARVGEGRASGIGAGTGRDTARLARNGSGTREVLERSLQRLGLAVTPAVELGSTTAIKAAVESGLGPPC